MIDRKVKKILEKISLRYKVALFIGLMSALLSSFIFLKKDLYASNIIDFFGGVVLILHLIYCGGFELSRGILPKSLCGSYTKITIILLTIFLLTFIMGIIFGYLLELIIKLIPYLKNEKIRRNFIFILLSIVVISIILSLVLSQNS